MRIKVINPNTTETMIRTIGEAASALGVLEEVRKGEAEGFDDYIIACFGDPGLLAAREIAKGPVVGIAEAAMHVASFIATGFSVVTTLSRTCIIAEHLAESYGMARFCRKVRGKRRARKRSPTPESLRRRCPRSPSPTRSSKTRPCSSTSVRAISVASARSACRSWSTNIATGDFNMLFTGSIPD